MPRQAESASAGFWPRHAGIAVVIVIVVAGASAVADPSPPATWTSTANTTAKGFGILKVLNLNAWGLNWPWSEDRQQRFAAIRDVIALHDYDVILMQEVWYRAEYDMVRSAVPYAAYYESLNLNCVNAILPLGCSGLVILSRHPIEAVEFKPFNMRGSFWKFDGEIFVAKGVGKARVRWRGLAVDVFTSHFVSYSESAQTENVYVRLMQSMETAEYIRNSNADIVLFGGDLNALPLAGERSPYGILRTVMRDALVDRYGDASQHPWFATYGNPRNTYTGDAGPQRIDYLMFNTKEGLAMQTREFIMPFYVTRNSKNELVSVSDHEALHAEFEVTPRADHAAKQLDFSNNNNNNNTDVSSNHVKKRKKRRRRR